VTETLKHKTDRFEKTASKKQELKYGFLRQADGSNVLSESSLLLLAVRQQTWA